MIQIITPDGAFFIDDTKSIIVNDNNTITFNVNGNGLSITGTLKLGDLSPLKSKVMEPFVFVRKYYY